MGRARDLANILSSSGNVALDSELGLSLITPTSIATTGGSATSSISSTGAVSFTSASAISLNDVFSATYDNYKIIFIVETSSTDSNIQIRLRASGSDNSTSVYNSATSTTSSLNQTSWSLNPTTTLQKFYSFELYYPKAAKNTYIKNVTGMFESGGAYVAASEYVGYFRNTTSFDAISFISSTGIITGTISIYGYKK